MSQVGPPAGFAPTLNALAAEAERKTTIAAMDSLSAYTLVKDAAEKAVKNSTHMSSGEESEDDAVSAYAVAIADQYGEFLEHFALDNKLDLSPHTLSVLRANSYHYIASGGGDISSLYPPREETAKARLEIAKPIARVFRKREFRIKLILGTLEDYREFIARATDSVSHRLQRSFWAGTSASLVALISSGTTLAALGVGQTYLATAGTIISIIVSALKLAEDKLISGFIGITQTDARTLLTEGSWALDESTRLIKRFALLQEYVDAPLAAYPFDEATKLIERVDKIRPSMLALMRRARRSRERAERGGQL
jgi:hypothetical protein